MAVQTKITKVAVYRHGAVIVRKGLAELKEGRNELLIRGLSAGADDRTVRLSLPEGIRGSNVQTRNLNEEERKEITEELTRKIEDAAARIELLETQAELWRSNADFTSKTSLDLKEMTEYLEKMPERIAKISEEIRALSKEKERLEKELKKKNPEVGGKVVTAEAEVTKAGTYPVEVRYHERNVQWYPVYELHTDGEGSDLTLRLRAKIRQMTGEDWKKVGVSLFTGDPSVSGTIPEIQPAHLRIYVPVVSSMRKNAIFGAAKMSMMESAPMMAEEEACEETDDTMEIPMADVRADYAEVNRGETMTEYELAGSWDLTDRVEVMADLNEETVKADYHIVAVPKLDDAAYLAAEVKIADIEHILETEAAVYLKGTYAGNVFVSPDMTKETYDLSLGRDESIRVKREQKRRHTSTVLLKGQKKTEYEYEITVSSRKEKPFRVTVFDQIPISDDKQIVVEKGEISGAKLEEDTGILRYDFHLEGGASKVLKIAYSVAWPKDKTIQGE